VYSYRKRSDPTKRYAVKRLHCNDNKECAREAYLERRSLDDEECPLVELIPTNRLDLVVMKEHVSAESAIQSQDDAFLMHNHIQAALRCLEEKFVSYFDLKMENVLFDTTKGRFLLADRASRRKRRELVVPIATYWTTLLYEAFGTLDQNSHATIDDVKWTEIDNDAYQHYVQQAHDSLNGLLLVMNLPDVIGMDKPFRRDCHGMHYFKTPHAATTPEVAKNARTHLTTFATTIIPDDDRRARFLRCVEVVYPLREIPRGASASPGREMASDMEMSPPSYVESEFPPESFVTPSPPSRRHL